jgi:diguanylate cyclase (GGDEF)-like protein
VLDANPAYTQILGVTRAEMLGTCRRCCARRRPTRWRASSARPCGRACAPAAAGAGELLERRRSGEICSLQVTISSVTGPQATLRYHVLVITDVTEQRLQRERLERQAHFDELTRLPNRASCRSCWPKPCAATDRDGYLLAVCYLDLDRFKPINDRHGHAAGDRLLAELAGRLRSALRTRDTWADTAARLGGDEFVLLLRAEHGGRSPHGGGAGAARGGAALRGRPGEEPVQVTASMGATVYPLDAATPTPAAPRRPRDVRRQAERAATATCSSTPSTAAAPKSA